MAGDWLRDALLFVAIVSNLLFLTGCATLVKGSSQSVIVNTDPQGATCTLTRKDKQIAIVNPTPGSVTVDKSKDAVTVSCKKDDYQESVGTMSSKFEPMTFGNILFGGVIGVVVDASSGAMNEYEPTVTFTLIPLEFHSIAKRDAFFDRMRADFLEQSDDVVQRIKSKCRGTECESQLKAAEDAKKARLAQIEMKRETARVTADVVSSRLSTNAPEPGNLPATISAVDSPTNAKQSGEISRLHRVGDKWRYKVSGIGASSGIVTIEIVETGSRKVRERITREGYPTFMAERDVEASFSPSRFQTEVALPGGYQLWEVAPYFPPGTQLTVGQPLGPVAGEFLISGSGRRSLRSQINVVGQERVRVPAGEFTAWRVETVSETALGPEPAVVTCTFWYSSEMMRTVKMHTETKWRIQADQSSETYELMAFNPIK